MGTWHKTINYNISESLSRQIAFLNITPDQIVDHWNVLKECQDSYVHIYIYIYFSSNLMGILEKIYDTVCQILMN